MSLTIYILSNPHHLTVTLSAFAVTVIVIQFLKVLIIILIFLYVILIEPVIIHFSSIKEPTVKCTLPPESIKLLFI